MCFRGLNSRLSQQLKAMGSIGLNWLWGLREGSGAQGVLGLLGAPGFMFFVCLFDDIEFTPAVCILRFLILDSHFGVFVNSRSKQASE